MSRADHFFILQDGPASVKAPAVNPTAAPAPKPEPVAAKPVEQPKPTPSIQVAPSPATTSAPAPAPSSVPSTPTKLAPSTATPTATPTRANSIPSRLSVGELAALDSPNGTPTKSKEITFSQPLATLVRTQTTRIRTLATNNTSAALKAQLDELAVTQDQVEAELRKVRLRNAELEKRSTQLEKDIETATTQLRDVLVGNLSTEEKLLQEREKLMAEQQVQGKIKGEVQNFQQQLSYTQEEARKMKSLVDDLQGQVAQRDGRIKELEAALGSDKSEMEHLQKKHAAELEDLKKTHQSALDALRAEYEAKMVQLSQTHAAAVQDLEARQKQALAEASSQKSEYSKLEQFVSEQKRRIQMFSDRRTRIFQELQQIDSDERVTLESLGVTSSPDVVPVSELVQNSAAQPEVVQVVVAAAPAMIDPDHMELKFDDDSSSAEQPQAQQASVVSDPTAGLVSLDDLSASFDAEHEAHSSKTEDDLI